MSDPRPNPNTALPESDRTDTGPAPGRPDYCLVGREERERRARLIRAIEAEIVPRLLISLGTARRRIAQAGVATEPSAQDLAEFAGLVAEADSNIDPSSLPNFV